MQNSVALSFASEWTKLANMLKLPPNVSRDVLDYLAQHYNGENRYYHNMRHITAMLDGARALPFDDAAAAKLAIFFHDVIYEARRREPGEASNEEKSALALEEKLKDYVAPETLAQAMRAIRATEPHVATDSRDINWVIDLDMAILGQPWAVYERYAKGIMKEYGGDRQPEKFYEGRSGFLTRELAKEAHFITPEFKHLEAAATYNLKRELGIMQAGVGFEGRTP